MRGDPDEVKKLFDIPKIQLILTKDESFYERQEEEKGVEDPFSSLNMALM